MPCSALRCVAVLLSLLEAAVAQEAPEQQPDARTARAAAVELTLRHEWRWGQDGAPALRVIPNYGPQFGRMALAAAGDTVAVESGGRVYLFAADGKTPTPAGLGATLAGADPAHGFLVAHEHTIWRCDRSDEEEDLKVEAPDRTDLFASPFAACMVTTGVARRGIRSALVPLDGSAPTELRPPQDIASVATVAWSGDGRQVAVHWSLFTAASRVGLGIEVFGSDGKSVRKLDSGEALVTAMDFSFDGRSLTWVADRAVCVDLTTGEQLATAATKAVLWCQIDPVVALSVDANGIATWAADGLRPARRVEATTAAQTFGKRTVGPVLGAAVDKKRTALALATLEGLRLYRIER